MTDNLPEKSEFLVYQTEDGRIKIDVRLEDETVWLTQQHMAELFQTTQQNISLHIRNIYDEAELIQDSTHKKYLSVRQEGKRSIKRKLDYYNLDMIISVGYRVKSHIATRFRIWATQRLKEYIIKGFVMDDERLKNPPVAGSSLPDYFDEMLERIRDIRASERRMYLRVKEIFAMAGDYNPSGPENKQILQHHPEQTALCHDRYDSGGVNQKARRCRPAQHGAHKLEGERSPQNRCDYCQELPS
jgi:hypothetical protein